MTIGTEVVDQVKEAFLIGIELAKVTPPDELDDVATLAAWFEYIRHADDLRTLTKRIVELEKQCEENTNE